ncbi:hypothetical protein JCM11641_007387 [Rhodosporidiobolus odoratus]
MVAHLSYKLTHFAQTLRGGHITNTLRNAFPSTATPAPTFDFTSNVFGSVSSAANSVGGGATAIGMAAGALGAGAGAAAGAGNGGAAGGAGGASSKAGNWSHFFQSSKSIQQGQAAQADSPSQLENDDDLRAFASPSARRSLLRRNRSPVGVRSCRQRLTASSPTRPSADLLRADEAGLSSIRLSGVEAQRMYHTAFSPRKKTDGVKDAEVEADEIDLGVPQTKVLETRRRASISLAGLARSSAPLMSAAGLSTPVRPVARRALHTSSSTSAPLNGPDAALPLSSTSRPTVSQTFHSMTSTLPPSPALPTHRRNSTSAVPSSTSDFPFASSELLDSRPRTASPQMREQRPSLDPKKKGGFGWARGKTEEEIVQIGEQAGQLVSQEALARRNAILAAEKTGSPQKVDRAVQQYLSDPRSWNINSHNIAMAALHKTRRPNDPLDSIVELYNQLFSTEGLHPTRVSYENIIRAFCTRDEEVRRNIAFLERRLKKKALAAKARGGDSASYDAEGQDERLKGTQEEEQLAVLRSPEYDYFTPALHIYKALGQLGDRLSTSVIQILLSCATDRGDVDVALALFERLEKSPYQRPTFRAYDSLIRLYGGVEKDTELVTEVFEAYLAARASGQLRQSEWGASGPAARPNFRRAAVKHAYDTAPEFVEDDSHLGKASETGSVDEFVWGTAIKSHFDAGDAAGAVALFERMILAQSTPETLAPGYPPQLTSRTVLIVVTSFIRTGDEVSARKWFDRFVNQKDGEPLRPAFLTACLYSTVDTPFLGLLNHIYRTMLSVASKKRKIVISDFVTTIDYNLARIWQPDAPSEEKQVALEAIAEFRAAFERSTKAGLLSDIAGIEFTVSTGLLSRILKAEAHNGLFPRAASTFLQLANVVRATMRDTPADAAVARKQGFRPRHTWALRVSDAALAAIGLRRTGEKLGDVELVPAGSPVPSVQDAVKIVSWTNKLRRVVEFEPESWLEQALVYSYLASRSVVKTPQELNLSGDEWYTTLEAFAHAAAAAARENPPKLPFEFPGFEFAFEEFLASGAEIPVGQGLYDYELFARKLRQSGMKAPEIRNVVDAMTCNMDHHAVSVDAEEMVAPKVDASPAPVEDDVASIASGSAAPATSATAASVADSAETAQQFPTPPSTPPSYFSNLPTTSPTESAPAPSSCNFDSNLGTRIEQLSFVTRAQDATRLAREAFLLATAAAREGRYAHPDSYGRLIEQLGRQHLVSEVRQVYLLAYDALTAMNDDAEAQSVAWVMLEDKMMIALAQAGELVDVGHHRDRLLQAGSAPSADAYASMILNMKDTTDDAAVALSLFEESQQLNVRPNVYLFNTLISKLSRARRAKDALQYFELMKQHGIAPSSITYGAIINACCKAGDDVSADFLFNEMVSRPDFKPRPPPFNTMIQFFVSTKPDRERALHYYSKLTKAGVKPTAHTYKLLLDAYGATGPEPDLESMQQVFARLVSDRTVAVSGAHWASMITAYGVVAKDADRAIAIFDSISAHPSTRNNPNGALPDAVVYEALLNALIANGQAELCDKYLAEMREKKIRMTAYVCNSLIKGYTSQSLYPEARRVFEAMSEPRAGVASLGNHPIDRHPKHHHQAAQGPAPVDAPTYREPSTYEAIIMCELKAEETVRAAEVLRLAEARAFPPAVIGRLQKLLADEGIESLPLQQ